jgi:hypothetical protein
MDLQRKIQQLRNDDDDEIADAIEDMIPRAIVADALAEIRSEFARRALSKGTDGVWRVSFSIAHTEIDTTIAKLGLADETQEEK